MENVLVIGGGGHEQALAWKLEQSQHVKTVYVAPGNGGNKDNIINVAISLMMHQPYTAFVEQNNIAP